MLPKRLKRLLKSSPPTLELLKYLESNEGIGSSSGSYDDSDLKSKMGYDSIPSNTNLQAEIESHTHTESEITDLGDYIEKSNTSGFVKNDGTIDTSTYLTQHQDISGKADNDHTHGNITSDGLLKINNSVKANKIVVTNDDGKITYTESTIPSDVSDLSDNNNTQFTPKSHTHTVSSITDFPSTMTPSTHNHTLSDITDLTSVAVTVTYSDNTTETINLIKQVITNNS